MSKIDKRAIVEDGAIIGDDVEIGPNVFISKDAKIGNRVIIHHSATIEGDTTIGDGCEIYSHAVIGSDPQDVTYQKEDFSKLIIGKNNKIREFCLFNPGTSKEDGVTIIGDNNFFLGYTHIAHDCKIGNNIIMANGVTLAGHIRVEDFAFIGGLTPIHQFVTIGEGAMIAGASALSQDVPPFCLAEGNRAVVKSLNLVGLRRRFEREDIDALNRAFKKLFRGGRNLKEAAIELYESEENEKVKKMCNFIINTKRGIPYER